jgi:hypothetical protein
MRDVVTTMLNTKDFLIPIAVAVVLSFLVFQPAAAFATVNGQTPNQQVLSSNTSNDYGSWARIEETTYQSFHISSSDPNCGADCFDMQVNSIANGAPYGCGTSCSYTWEIQGFADITHNNGGSIGAWVADAGLEVWNKLSGPLFCYLYPSTLPNINGSSHLVQEEFFLTSSTQVENALTADGAGGVNYSNHATCNYPSGNTVAYLTDVEGIVVGYAGGEHASFTPLSSQLFSGYIDLISNYNHMSSSSKSEQSAETSNLYQTSISYSGSTYGTNMYIYTASFDENTKTGT